MEQTVQFSDWQKRKVTTFLVSAKESNSVHLSLQEIIDRATPGCRISLQSGNFPEQIVVSKPIEIVAEGNADVRFTSRNPCLTVVGGAACFFSRLKFVGKGPQALSAKTSTAMSKEPPAVNCTSGKVTFTHCEMTSIYIGGNSAAELEQCIIVGNQCGCGLRVADHADCIVQRCDITSHATYCLEVTSRGSCEFIENDIRANHNDPDCLVGDGLVWITGPLQQSDTMRTMIGSVEPLFKGNKIVDNFGDREATQRAHSMSTKDSKGREMKISFKDLQAKRSAVAIEGLAAPKFMENTISGGFVGVYLSGSSGIFEANFVSNSVLCGILACSGASPRFHQNTIAGHLGPAIIADIASPTLSGNVIKQCTGCALIASTTPSISVEGNTIRECEGGIRFMGHCTGKMEGNKIMNNTGFGAKFSEPGCSVSVSDNILQHNGAVGLAFTNGAHPKVSQNTISGHHIGALINQSAAPMLQRNTIQGEEQHYAVFITENGKGLLWRNEFLGGTQATVRVSDSADPTFIENVIADGIGVGVLVTEGGIGHFEKNDILRHPDGVRVSLFADPLFEKNQIMGCMNHGLIVEEEGIGTFVGNTFDKNYISAICRTGGEPTVRGNVFTDAREASIVCSEGSRALIEKNSFESADTDHIVLTGKDCDNRVLRNVIAGARRHGVVSQNEATGIVHMNEFSKNKGGGYGTRDRGKTDFARNQSKGELGPALFCQQLGEGIFTQNVALSGTSHGLVIESQGTPTVSKCLFSRNGGHGIVLLGGSQGVIEECESTLNQASGLHIGGHSITAVKGIAITLNMNYGVHIGSGGDGLLESAKISQQPVGIFLQQAGPFLFRDCEIFENKCGVQCVGPGGKARLASCHVHHSTESLLEIRDYGDVTMEDCALEQGETGILSLAHGHGSIQNTTISNCQNGAKFQAYGATHLDKCTITHCITGAMFEKYGSGHLQTCTITQNADNVIVDVGGRGRIEGCAIEHSQRGHGMTVRGECIIEKNQICKNCQDGVELGAGSRPTLKENEIRDNRLNGISCQERSNGLITENVIAGNRMMGVFLAASSDVSFVKNRIEGNDAFGIECGRGAGGSFRENDVCDSEMGCIHLSEHCTTTFEKNNVSNANSIGFVVSTASCARIVGNKICKNSSCGALICGPSGTTFEGNTITENGIGALFEEVIPPNGGGPKKGYLEMTYDEMCNAIREDLGTTLFTTLRDASRGAEIFRTLAGLPVSVAPPSPTNVSRTASSKSLKSSQSQQQQQLLDESNPFFRYFFRSIALRREGDGGMLFRSLSNKSMTAKGSAAIFRKNVFSDNQQCGGRFEALSEAHFREKNEFLDETIGILCVSRAGGEVSHCSFCGCDAGISVDGSDQTTKISDNTFDANTIGLTVKVSATMKVRGCNFKRHEHCGISVGSNGKIHLQYNKFEGDAAGIIIGDGGSAEILQNNFLQCRTGILFSEPSTCTVTKNLFVEGCEIAILAQGGTGTIRHNVFSRCSVAGVCVEKAAAQQIEKNLFCRNSDSQYSCGVLTRHGGAQARIIENDIHKNSVGIHAEADGSATFSANFIHDNDMYGALIGALGVPTISKCFFVGNRLANICALSDSSPNVVGCFLRKPCPRDGGGEAKKEDGGSGDGEPQHHIGIELQQGCGGNYTGNVFRDLSTGVFVIVDPIDWSGQQGPQEPSRTGQHVAFAVQKNLFVGCSVGVDVECNVRRSLMRQRSTLRAKRSQSFKVPLPPNATPQRDSSISQPTSGGKAAPMQLSRDVLPPVLPPLAQRLQQDVQDVTGGRGIGIFVGNLVVNCATGAVCHGDGFWPPAYIITETFAQREGYGDELAEMRKGAQPRSGPGLMPSTSKADFPGLEPSRSSFALLGPPQYKDFMLDPELYRMVVFEENVFTGGECGISVMSAAQARFVRNAISQCSRGGILVTEDGRGQFFQNVVGDCPAVGISINGTNARCFSNFEENLVYGCRTNFHIMSGEPRLFKNLCHSAEIGVLIEADVTAYIEANTIYNNRRIGCACSSERIVLTDNNFFHPFDTGALEVRLPNMRHATGNVIHNQFSARIAKPDFANTKPAASLDAIDARPIKDELALFRMLREVHENELPECSLRGCPACSEPFLQPKPPPPPPQVVLPANVRFTKAMESEAARRQSSTGGTVTPPVVAAPSKRVGSGEARHPGAAAAATAVVASASMSKPSRRRTIVRKPVIRTKPSSTTESKQPEPESPGERPSPAASPQEELPSVQPPQDEQPETPLEATGAEAEAPEEREEPPQEPEPEAPPPETQPESEHASPTPPPEEPEEKEPPPPTPPPPEPPALPKPEIPRLTISRPPTVPTMPNLSQPRPGSVPSGLAARASPPLRASPQFEVHRINLELQVSSGRHSAMSDLETGRASRTPSANRSASGMSRGVGSASSAQRSPGEAEEAVIRSRINNQRRGLVVATKMGGLQSLLSAANATPERPVEASPADRDGQQPPADSTEKSILTGIETNLNDNEPDEQERTLRPLEDLTEKTAESERKPEEEPKLSPQPAEPSAGKDTSGKEVPHVRTSIVELPPEFAQQRPSNFSSRVEELRVKKALSPRPTTVPIEPIAPPRLCLPNIVTPGISSRPPPPTADGILRRRHIHRRVLLGSREGTHHVMLPKYQTVKKGLRPVSSRQFAHPTSGTQAFPAAPQTARDLERKPMIFGKSELPKSVRTRPGKRSTKAKISTTVLLSQPPTVSDEIASAMRISGYGNTSGAIKSITEKSSAQQIARRPSLPGEFLSCDEEGRSNGDGGSEGSVCSAANHAPCPFLQPRYRQRDVVTSWEPLGVYRRQGAVDRFVPWSVLPSALSTATFPVSPTLGSTRSPHRPQHAHTHRGPRRRSLNSVHSHEESCPDP